eukprot:TRINITY_DN15555_c1_g1_i3.p1 TRINITY_DN15555_c1_g1~~TRINITY_DN15555_c1_g1_i3.p1  ORF type:complete len:618 (-),score=82.24 TRINITY_DN15555_c1_g1_i3:436-2289(-)
MLTKTENLSVEALSKLMNSIASQEIFGLSAADLEDFAIDHAPHVIDLFALMNERSIVFIALPEPILPDFDSASAHLLMARKAYFVSFGIQGVALCMMLGVVLTMIRNFVLRTCSICMTPSNDYQPVRSSTTSRLSRMLQGVMNSRAFLAALVLGQTWILVIVAMACVTNHTMNSHMGVGYEFWWVYFCMTFVGALLEVVVSSLRDGALPSSTYPQKSLLASMPLLSEKYDTAKDVVLSAISLSKGEPVCAALNLCILLASQVYFICSPDVKGELLEAYCPVLTTPLTGFDVKADADDRTVTKKVYDFVTNELMVVLIKQATPARRTITIAEDIPQGCISMYLALVGKASWFCVMSMVLSLVRLVMTVDWVANGIRSFGRVQLRKRLLQGITSRNIGLAVGVTKELLSAGLSQVIGGLSQEEFGTLLEMINTDPQPLLSEAHNPAFVAMLAAASCVDETGDTIKHFMEGADVKTTDQDGMTALHFAAMYGALDAIGKLTQLGAAIDAADENGGTPLHWAAANGRVECLETLKELGASIEAKNNDGRTALHIAAYYGEVASIEKLQTLGANLDTTDNEGDTPLHFAVSHGGQGAVDKLQQLGATVTIKNKRGKAALEGR